MGANNSTLLEIVIEDAPLKDVAFTIDISATAVNKTNFIHASDNTIQVNMAPGQGRHKITIPKGTTRILLNASLAGYTSVRLNNKELTIQLRE